MKGALIPFHTFRFVEVFFQKKFIYKFVKDIKHRDT